jgi:hypothetical protein
MSVANLWIVPVVVAGVAVAGCVAHASEADASQQSADLVGGSFTFDRPEIGKLGLLSTNTLCTATLIRPSAVVMAAHCVKWESADAGYFGTFFVERSEQEVYEFDVVGYRAWGQSGQGGADDVAIARLGTDVPATVAIPAQIATQAPQAGAEVTIFGYGCHVRLDANGQRPASDSYTGHKQERSFPFGDIRWICPGDSGGPTAIGTDGPIFQVSSWLWWDPPTADAFGDLVKHRSDIDAALASWGL